MRESINLDPKLDVFYMEEGLYIDTVIPVIYCHFFVAHDANVRCNIPNTGLESTVRYAHTSRQRNTHTHTHF
jgi:hypothetical protein